MKQKETSILCYSKSINKYLLKSIVKYKYVQYNFLKVEDYISETAIVLEKHRDYEVLTGLKWYFIELPKFRKQNLDMNEKINQWLAFIDDYNKEMVKVAEEKNDKLKKARIEMNYLTGDAEVRRLAKLREKWEMDRISAINHAARKAEERRRKKTERKNGKIEGAKEKSIEIAKKLLEMGMTIEQIIDATQLSKEEIEKLLEEKQYNYIFINLTSQRQKSFDWYFLCLCFFRYSGFLHINM